MAQSKDDRNMSPFSAAMPSMTPVFAIFNEMGGSFLESIATAQKDWVDFVHQRIKEDVAVSRQLIQCQSLPEWHQVYSQYLARSMEQYKQQSTKVVQRGQAVAEHIAEATENGKEGARRH